MEENKIKDPKEQTMSRLERRALEEQQEKMQKAREEELERKRQELKATLFDDAPKKNVYKREIPEQKINKNESKPKKDVFTRVFLSITVLLALTFLFYMIIEFQHCQNRHFLFPNLHCPIRQLRRKMPFFHLYLILLYQYLLIE